MHNQILLILGLLFAMALLYMLSQKLRVPVPDISGDRRAADRIYPRHTR